MVLRIRTVGLRAVLAATVFLLSSSGLAQAPADTTAPTTTTAPVTSTTATSPPTGAQSTVPGATSNTSTIAFDNALRVETPPIRPESWWRTPAAAALIAAAISLLNVVVVMWFNRSSLKQKERELTRTLEHRTEEMEGVLRQKEEEVRLSNRQKDIEEERRSIYKQLTEFYGPLQQLLSVSKDLTEAFKNGRDFRTLVELLRGVKYEGNDERLLDEIISVTNEIEKLIMTKSGLVEEPELRETLSRAVAHFRILKLAKAGALKDETERFEKYVFPKTDGAEPGLEKRVDDQIAQLRTRLAGLTAQPPVKMIRKSENRATD